MKNLSLFITSTFVITACGGSGDSRPITVNVTPQANEQTVDSNPSTATENTQSAPADNPAPTTVPTQATPPPATTPAVPVSTATEPTTTTPTQTTPPATPTPTTTPVAPAPEPVAPTPEPTPVSQWGGRTWSCVSNVPEITARWQLQINHDRTLVDLSRPTVDPLRLGTWIDNGNAGFTVVWADNRSFDYLSLGAGFIDDGGSRCHENFYPARPNDPQSNPPAAQETLPDLGDGEWEYPIFYCKAWSNPSNVWAWAFSENGHLRDHNRIIAGSYLFQSEGLQMFITNQNDEVTQWSIVDGKSLTISWGGCAHVAGPTLREVDLSANTSDYCLACH